MLKYLGRCTTCVWKSNMDISWTKTKLCAIVYEKPMPAVPRYLLSWPWVQVCSSICPGQMGSPSQDTQYLVPKPSWYSFEWTFPSPVAWQCKALPLQYRAPKTYKYICNYTNCLIFILNLCTKSFQKTWCKAPPLAQHLDRFKCMYIKLLLMSSWKQASISI